MFGPDCIKNKHAVELDDSIFRRLFKTNLVASGKQHREEISSVLCDHVEGWDREGGRETQERGDMGRYMYTYS